MPVVSARLADTAEKGVMVWGMGPLDYVAEEYFLSGDANVYGYDAAGKTVVERSGVSYTTRLLVVRPKDPKRFSGSVQLNMFHPSMAHHQWSRISAYVIRHGDAFVAVGVGADPRQRETPASGPPTAAHLVPTWYEPVRPDREADQTGRPWRPKGDTRLRVRLVIPWQLSAQLRQ